MKIHRDSRLLVVLLGALTAVGPFTTDTYIPGMPSIRDEYGVSMTAVQLTLSMAMLGGAIMLGNISGYVMSSRIVLRLGLDSTLTWGIVGAALAGALLAGFAWFGVHHVATLVGPMMAYMFSLALAGPQAIAGALTPFPRAAGTASSLMGFFQSLTSAAVGMGVAFGFDGTPRALASFVCLMGVCAMLAHLGLVRRIPPDERQRVHS